MEGGRGGGVLSCFAIRLMIALMGRWIVSAYTRTHSQLYYLVLSKSR